MLSIHPSKFSYRPTIDSLKREYARRVAHMIMKKRREEQYGRAPLRRSPTIRSRGLRTRTRWRITGISRNKSAKAQKDGRSASILPRTPDLAPPCHRNRRAGCDCAWPRPAYQGCRYLAGADGFAGRMAAGLESAVSGFPGGHHPPNPPLDSRFGERKFRTQSRGRHGAHPWAWATRRCLPQAQ